MSLEDDLRVTLRDRAAEPVPQPDLWHTVSAGVRRDRRRRAALAGGAAAVALAAVASVPVILANRADRVMPTPPATAPTGSPAVDWAWPSWPEPAFPRKPGWVPPGVGQPSVTVMGANVLLHYERASSILEAEIGPLEPEWETEGEEEHGADVGGREATVRTASFYDGARAGEQFVGVRWRTADGDWAQVRSWGERDEQEVLKFARHLSAGSVPAGPAPVTLAVVPPGLNLQHQSALPDQGGVSLCVATPETVASERQPSGLCADVLEEPFDPMEEAGPELLTIGGRPAAFYPETGRLEVDRGGGRVLAISWDPERLPLSRAEAIRFAEGVTVP
ncbi:hypothetical protein AB0F72_37695 [Actinoplanes sp. NPDC023936]|uniref:hypothetical protein n=1 Tax=Actinoplanes sp. NPDC023936 TaxID=3154910 RepID=UPI0033C103DD